MLGGRIGLFLGSDAATGVLGTRKTARMQLANDRHYHVADGLRVYLAIKRTLSSSCLRQALGIFVTELRSSFDGNPGDAASRTEHHHRAHTLSAASAMIGFTALSVACPEIAAFEVAKVEREGVEAYAARLAEACKIASCPEDTIEDLFADIGL